MKSLIIFAVVFTLLIQACIACLLGDAMKSAIDECMAMDNSLTTEDIEKLFAGEYDDSTDKRITCFVKCTLEEMRFFENGTLLEEEIYLKFEKVADHEQLKNTVEECKNMASTNDDECMVAMEINVCMVKKLREEMSE